jgi:ABC-type nitrate/sulfonate/bicarbonate transport system substrate-binding protein
LNFWVAYGAGCFRDQGLDVELVIPPSPDYAVEYLHTGKAVAGVLPSPLFLLDLHTAEPPLVLLANLLRNDPINLVVRKDFAAERHLSAQMPLVERLKGLRGARIGIAPNPPTRLDELFGLANMKEKTDFEVVVLRKQAQVTEFREGRIDALYAHTPYLEEVLANDGAVLLVNQSSGEVARLADRQIHVFAATRQFVDSNPDQVHRLVAAIAAAQQIVHTDQARTFECVRTLFPDRSADQLRIILGLYTPAVPERPDVSQAGLERALELFPANRVPPQIPKSRMQRAFVNTADESGAKQDERLEH